MKKRNHNMSRISAVVAIDQNRGIGKNNDLLVKIPSDLKRFRQITMGHPIVMGRKTYESIGRPLPNRTNIVVTSNPDFHPEGVLVYPTIEEALARAQDIDPEEVCIIGGGAIFEQTIDQITRLYLTIIEDTYDADVFFPDYAGFTHIIEESRHSEVIDGNEVAHRYTVLER